MSMVVVRHRVNDFDVWKAAFDDALEMRKSAGEQSYEILVGSDDRLLVVGIFRWDSPERAKAFFESDRLKDAMTAAGVAEEPEVLYLEPEFNG